jgi:hypothetical protein
VFLDNLFLNVSVAHALLYLRVGVMGTTRKNAAGVPPELIALKDRNTPLLYGGNEHLQVGESLCFAWQDNNIVLGITTAFSLDTEPQNWIWRNRRRPKNSSTNAAIARPIFGDDARKDLSIPACIDAYNHHMNGIDRANQLRGNLSCHRQYELRNWRPLAYWLWDVCSTNAFVIWKLFQSEKQHKAGHLHEEFEKALIHQFLLRGLNHQPGKLDKRRRCAWGARHPERCRQGKGIVHRTKANRSGHRRVPLAERVNESRPAERSRNVNTGCTSCKVYLCMKKGCFDAYHQDLIAKALWLL